MKTTLMDLVKQILTTTQDRIDMERGGDRVADAEREVRETLALLKARRDTISIEKRRDRHRL